MRLSFNVFVNRNHDHQKLLCFVGPQLCRVEREASVKLALNYSKAFICVCFFFINFFILKFGNIVHHPFNFFLWGIYTFFPWLRGFSPTILIKKNNMSGTFGQVVPKWRCAQFQQLSQTSQPLSNDSRAALQSPTWPAPQFQMRKSRLIFWKASLAAPSVCAALC